MHNQTKLVAAMVMALVCATTGPAAALINPNYTPVDLVTDSEAILRLTLGPVELDGGAKLRSGTMPLPIRRVKALHGGDGAPADPRILLDGSVTEVREKLLKALTGPEAGRALLFYGDLSAARSASGSGREQPAAMLHIGTYWFALYPGDGGALMTGRDELRLKTVWAGSDRMLQKALEYIIHDVRAEVPVVSGVRWSGETLLPDPGGEVFGLQAVELTGRTAPGLFVQSAAGDRFYQASESGEFRDLTDELRLTTESMAAAWGDFDGDGRLDLASWDGQMLTFCRMTKTGALSPEPTGLAIEGVVSLTAVGARNVSRLLAATPDGPVLASRRGDGRWGMQPLGKASSGKPGPIAAADVTGDGLADGVQLFASDVLVARGTAEGSFREARPAWANPEGTGDRVLVSEPADLLTGDYDADGLIDLLAIGRGPGDVQLLRNAGGRFLSAVAEAGEITYNTGESRPRGAVAWDVNNDGREEFLLTSATDCPLPFFNRGFRTFGYARGLELAGSGLPPGAQALNRGQQAGVAADFDGDGMQEVALAAADGRLVVLRVALNAGRGLALRVAVPPGSAREVTVTAFEGKRPLGARTAAPGKPARFGKRRKGPLLLRWIDASGTERSKRVVVLEPMRIELPAPE